MLDELTGSNKVKESEGVNSVVFGTVKGSKIGSFWMDCEGDLDEQENNDENLLDFKKNSSFQTKKEREKKYFYDIYEEIMAICERVGCCNPIEPM